MGAADVHSAQGRVLPKNEAVRLPFRGLKKRASQQPRMLKTPEEGAGKGIWGS
jgi:hypothetical protein